MVKIPNENDGIDKLIFLEANKIKNLKRILPLSKNKYTRILREKPGFIYSATNEKLRLCFNDCFCLFTKSVGFTDNMLLNYKKLKNFLHTTYLRIDEENLKKSIAGNVDETEECKFSYIIT